jgi:endo-1,4-beta-mannosidase
MIIGLCEDYPEESRSLESARRDLAAARALGAQVLRIAFAWDAIESEPGQYDWTFWDRFVEMADEADIRLIPYICYTPRWAADAGGDERFWRHPPKDPSQFAQFVTILVNRYKDRIQSWELWNEPDNPDYWVGTIEQYAQLVKAGSQAVRAADPSAVVVLGGVAWELDFVERLLRDHDLSRSVDVINVHSYFETWSPDPLEFLPQYVGRLREIIQRYGDHQQIYMAEVGYSSYRHGAAVSSAYWCAFDYEHSEAYQAQQLFKTLTLLAADGDVALVAWYRINDLPDSQEVIGDVNNRHLGLYRPDASAKPAAAALATFTRLMHGAWPIDALVSVNHSIDSDAQIHAFQRPNGNVVIVGWLQTNIRGNRPFTHGGDAHDRRKQSVRVTVASPPLKRRAIDLTLRGGELTILELTQPAMHRVELSGAAAVPGAARGGFSPAAGADLSSAAAR